jgi:hypothetical protein
MAGFRAAELPGVFHSHVASKECARAGPNDASE